MLSSESLQYLASVINTPFGHQLYLILIQILFAVKENKKQICIQDTIHPTGVLPDVQSYLRTHGFQIDTVQLGETKLTYIIWDRELSEREQSECNTVTNFRLSDDIEENLNIIKNPNATPEQLQKFVDTPVLRNLIIQHPNLSDEQIDILLDDIPLVMFERLFKHPKVTKERVLKHKRFSLTNSYYVLNLINTLQ